MNTENNEHKSRETTDSADKIDRPISHPLISLTHLSCQVIVYIRQSSRKQVEEHTGSTEYQRSLVGSALRLGWKQSQIIMIEDDLGLSAVASSHRPGWKKMLDLIRSGSAKAVITANTARLSRNLVDLMELLTLAARTGTLLILDGKIVDPNDDSDIFFSRILGSLAEYENRIRAEAMRRARLTKVMRGEVAMSLATGFIKRPDGSVVKDPEVKASIDRVLQAFRETRSARGTTIALRKQGFKMPRRRHGQVEWVEPEIAMVCQILKNPIYSGTFVYGRSKVAPELGKSNRGWSRTRKVPEHQWVKFQNHFPGYITPEEQQEFINALKKNNFTTRHRPGKGTALCQGLVVCGRCGSKLRVNY